MATDRQIAANRINAQSSTGPRTAGGKRRSRRNSFRHGLTAESVITVLEDKKAYRRFEAIILHDHAPETAVERALVSRLASLLWRLRRATAIETGLFQIQAQILRDRRHDHNDPNDPLKVFYDLLRQARGDSIAAEQIGGHYDAGQSAHQQQASCGRLTSRALDPTEMAICFLRLENFNPTRLDLIGRYETRLGRQLAQTIVLLHSIRSRRAPIRKFLW